MTGMALQKTGDGEEGNADAVFASLWREYPAPLQLETTCYLGLEELAAISDTEPYGQDAHHELKFRANGLFVKWFLDEERTWGMMHTTHTAMSGSAGLYVCQPGPWTPGDLDFYCPLDRLDEVVDFFKTQQYVDPDEDQEVNDGDVAEGVADVEEGTTNETEDDADDGATDGTGAAAEVVELYPSVGIMKKVVTMYHATSTPEHQVKINIIESGMPSAEAPIFAFHSTVVMNVVTSKGVTCFYPEWTLKGKGVVNFPAGFGDWARNGKRDRAAHEKYRERGYALHVYCSELHEQGKQECDACSPGFRNWRDGALFMPFVKGDDMEPSEMHYYWQLGSPAMECNDWKERGVTILCEGIDDTTDGYMYHGTLRSVQQVGGSETGAEEAESGEGQNSNMVGADGDD